MDESRLSKVALFASLSKGDRKKLAALADEVDLPEGKELLHEDAFAYEFFVIEEGTAVVTRNGQQLAELGPGDFFGEMGAISQSRRNATIRATSPMRAIVMSAGDFRRLAAESPDIAQTIRATVEARSAAPA